MALSTSTTEESAAGRLESALRGVLGLQFEEELRGLVEHEVWYNEFLEVHELIRLWIQGNLARSADPLWVFQPVRTSERKLLADHLGLDRASIVGKSPAEVAKVILNAIGLPDSPPVGLRQLRIAWEEIGQLISDGQVEKAAILSRQRAERFLRTLLYFYSATLTADTVLQIIEAPGNLNIPRRLHRVNDAPPETRRFALLCALREDGWADLGFLTLVLRKLSSRLEESGVYKPILTQADSDAMLQLARTLQNYAHDRALRSSDRSTQLSLAVQAVCDLVAAQIGRDIVPDELVVIENGNSIFGALFEGVTEDGRFRKLWSDRVPKLGSRILFVATTRARSTGCIWTESLWPMC